jgi:hypothetical protein
MNIFKKKFIFLLPALAFLLWPSIRAEAQSPGGVGLGNVELWLKADAPITEGGGKVTLWEDKSGRGRNFGNTWSSVTIAPASLPTYNQESFLMNFWPSVDFRAGTSIRLIGPNFLPTVTTSRSAYYVFYVSERDASTVAGDAGVYGLNATSTGGHYYNFLGWKEGRPFFNLVGLGIANSHQGNGKQYGVNVAILPNSSTVAPQSYLNGILNTTSFTARELNQGNAAAVGVIGGASQQANQAGFKGNVQEIIVLSGPQHSELPYNDLQKINSYLALKYGIGLEAGNYVNSSGTDIWNRTANNGYNNNIFGLGRDNNSGLIVKQATTYGTPTLLTAFVGTSLATLNSQNTGTLDNNVFVLFGSNGATDREKYQAQIGSGFSATLFEYRLKAASKVQLTGAPTLVLNLKVNRAASSYAFDRVLVSSRPDFDPAATQSYTIGSGDIASNITLRNGDYISFGKTQTLPTPAELNGLAVKIYATSEDSDVKPIDHGQPVGSWINTLLRQGANAWPSNSEGNNNNRPTMNKQDNLMNFRPSIRFATNQYLFAPTYTASQDPPGQYLPMHPDSMYYLFYVSKSNNLSGGRSVIYHRGNQFGWKDGVPAYNTAGGDLNATTTQAYQLSDPTKKGFGITGLVHPNTTTIPVTLYFNGEWQQMPAGTIRTDRTNLVVGGSTSQFAGDIQEMAVFATPNKNGAQPLSIGIIRIINSTLAVKYGISLTEGDYVLPDTIMPVPPIYPGGIGQTTIWSRSKAVDATGKKYEQTVFGIGRSADIKGLSVMSVLGIHQNQARPYTPNNPNGSPFAVYVGSSLTGLNSDNSASILPKGVFLMFGADEELTTPTRGMEESYLAGTEFANTTTLPEDVDARTAVFKAQLSSSPLVIPATSSLDVKFQKMLNFPPNSYLLVSQSPEFEPDNTHLYTFNSSGTTGDVRIKNGDYVTIVTQSQYDPGPGGVANGLRFWMRAEPNFLTKGADNRVTEWRDAAGVVPDLKYNNVGTRPLPVYKEFDPHSNYHPGVVFNEGVQNTTGGAILASPKGMMSVQAPPVFTFFTVLNNDFTYNTLTGGGHRAYPIGFGNYSNIDVAISENRYPAFGIQSTPDKTAGVGRFVDKSGNTQDYDRYNGNSTLFRPRATMIMVHEVEKGRRIRYEFDAYGEDVSTTNTNMGSDFRMSTSPNVIGGGSYEGRYLHGPLSEIFAYERQLTQSEKNSIYAYLGLKYGITIDLNKQDETINFHYVLSNGTPVWPGNQADHQKYHNRVAALVRDDMASLFNKRARSTGDDAILFMGLQDNTGNWTDFTRNRSTIAWGSTDMQSDSVIFVRDIPTICGDLDERMRRVWMVDNSDPNKTEVIIRIGTSYLGKYGNKGAYQAFMLVADSEDKLKAGSIYPYDDATHNWDEVVPGRLVLTDEGYEHEFRYRFQGKLTYLTFGFKALGGTCPTCGFDGTKNLAFNSNTWNSSTNTTSGGVLDLEGGFRVLASVTKNLQATNLSTQLANNSLRINRSNNPTGTITTSILLQDTAAATSFEVYDIGGGANAYDRVEIVGICDGQETYPKLYYMTNETNSTYTIRLNVATGKRNRASSYTSENSRLRVVFPFPVREVQVRYTMPGSTANTTGTIGVGPVSYTCPPTLPPLNEAMLAFAQSVSKNPLQFCSDFRYRFTVTNGNCSPKYVNLIDTLPDYLYVDTLLLGDAYEQGVTNIDMSGRFNGRQILKIDKLNLNSGNSILDVVIGFTIPGATAKNYTNTAVFTYEYTWLDQPRDGKEWVSATATVTGSPADLNWNLLNWEFASDFECYRDDAEYTYKLNIKNPNYITYPSIDYGTITFTLTSQDLRAIAGHSDSIRFLNNSFKFNGTPINVSNITTVDDGLIVTGLGSPNLEVNTLEFKIETPERDDLVSKFGITFDFSTDSGDDCVVRLFNRMYGTKDILPCDGRSGVINNRDTTSKIKR